LGNGTVPWRIGGNVQIGSHEVDNSIVMLALTDNVTMNRINRIKNLLIQYCIDFHSYRNGLQNSPVDLNFNNLKTFMKEISFKLEEISTILSCIL
jgi:hypothetical protein